MNDKKKRNVDPVDQSINQEVDEDLDTTKPDSDGYGFPRKEK